MTAVGRHRDNRWRIRIDGKARDDCLSRWRSTSPWTCSVLVPILVATEFRACAPDLMWFALWLVPSSLTDSTDFFGSRYCICAVTTGGLLEFTGPHMSG